MGRWQVTTSPMGLRGRAQRKDGESESCAIDEQGG